MPRKGYRAANQLALESIMEEAALLDREAAADRELARALIARRDSREQRRANLRNLATRIESLQRAVA